MKRNMKSLLIAVSVLSAIGFTSCDENATIEVPIDEEIKYNFEYSDIVLQGTPTWQIMASDTINGENLTELLASSESDNKTVDAIKSANVKNGKLYILDGGTLNFTGIDSIKLVYHFEGQTQEYALVVGAPRGTNNDTIFFNDVKIMKEEAFNMIQMDKVVSLKVLSSGTPNCFVKGTMFEFTANATLDVLASAATGGSLF